MNKNRFNDIVKDIQSFADDEYEVIADSNTGDIMFCRNGKDISINVSEDVDTGTIMVNDGANFVPYPKYLREVLAELSCLADKIIQKYNVESHFVDSQSILYNEIGTEGTSLDILEKEISGNYSGTKICFVTADAGYGKSMLLRQFQYKKAKEFLDHKSKYVFLHIDLHGRELVRLNEAIMFELVELRVRGIYYSTILTLVKHKLVVLGIDGFDELAVEIGGEKALGSLSSFVSQMDGNGALIAASRRTFFDTQNYIQQTRILHNYIDSGDSCMFNEIKIKNWEKEQCVKYLDEYAYSENDYEELAKILNPKNPLLARPYLFTKLVQFSYDDSISPVDFVKKSDNHLDTINEIIDAFIRREVEKFSNNANDNITGEPYLTFGQHRQFLATVAEEMWNNKKDFLSKESIQLLLTILMEEWKISEDIKHKVLRMVDSYALLINTNDNDRKFDHEEFKNYFLAIALSGQIDDAVRTGQWSYVSAFLNTAQLPDTVADYLAKNIDNGSKISVVKGLLTAIIQKEWKPTYVQPNVGTIIPYVLDNIQNTETIEISDVIFSSLVFENKKIQNIVFNKCTFTNISYRKTELVNIKFENCSFSGLKINGRKNRFNNVIITESCDIKSISYSSDGINYDSEYSPTQIDKLLNAYGIKTNIISIMSDANSGYEPTDFYKTVKKLINKYSRVSWIYKKNIEEGSYISSNPKMVIDEIIPLLVKYDIIKIHSDGKTKQASTISYGLKYEINEILGAEDDCKSQFYNFWNEVKQRK